MTGNNQGTQRNAAREISTIRWQRETTLASCPIHNYSHLWETPISAPSARGWHPLSGLTKGTFGSTVLSHWAQRQHWPTDGMSYCQPWHQELFFMATVCQQRDNKMLLFPQQEGQGHACWTSQRLSGSSGSLSPRVRYPIWKETESSYLIFPAGPSIQADSTNLISGQILTSL